MALRVLIRLNDEMDAFAMNSRRVLEETMLLLLLLLLLSLESTTPAGEKSTSYSYKNARTILVMSTTRTVGRDHYPGEHIHLGFSMPSPNRHAELVNCTGTRTSQRRPSVYFPSLLARGW